MNNENKNIIQSRNNARDKQERNQSINNLEPHVIPIGLTNPQSYCYLNSIIQMLFGCIDFRSKMIEYHQSYKDTTNNQDESKQIVPFVDELGELFLYMKQKNDKLVQNSVMKFQKNFENSIDGDDIHKCYLQILTKVNMAVKKPLEERVKNEKNSNVADLKYLEFKRLNSGFIFDQFGGIISFTTKCKSCNKQIGEKFQMFKSIPLQISISKDAIKIEDIIKMFFENSEVIDGDYSCCSTSNIFSIPQITHAPKFLFIYFVRGAYNFNVDKKDTFITFGKQINIPTINGEVPYMIKSVVDHIGNNKFGHYFLKSNHGSNWWLKNDFQVRTINYEDVPTKNSIGLFLEMGPYYKPSSESHNQSVYKNIFEATINIFYSCEDFREMFIDFYNNFDYKLDLPLKETWFIQNIGKIMYHLQNKNMEIIEEIVNNICEYLPHASSVHECYSNILSNIKFIESKYINISEPQCESKMNEKSYSSDKLFSGEMLYISICSQCKNTTNEGIKNVEFIPIRILKSQPDFHECLTTYFKKKSLEGIKCKDCKKFPIYTTKHLKNAPKYLLFYLLNVETNKYFNFDDGAIIFSSIYGCKSYSLIATISKEDDKYFTKYNSEDRKTTINSSNSKEEKTFFNDMLKGNVIYLMMKLVSEEKEPTVI